ncbi:SDR family oxidoreductase [Streptomyces sp. ISL-11]|uniref:SDR family oxidoreductase n=1 Tax=Streptomyces sp. ISL-11 TaxID=2819174 RepID=UPI001BE6B653|nr:SDR family oxidoreductase [Streptomyces sp. ISL-11]MBT2383306.1 SDR family oxidoreductase [Streptomyces sp. ISL-11]
MARSVMVTGATSGVGLATALRLAGAGYEVFATARSAEKAEKLDALASERGVALRTVLLDVADPGSCQEAVDRIARQTDGGPWGLVNNAGIPLAGAVEDVDDEAARRLLEVNVLGPARLARLVLPAMRRRGEGRIVNISSLGGRVTAPGMGWYCGGKAALGSLNHALRMEAAPSGVRVVLIHGAGYASAIWERAADDLADLAASGRSPHAEIYRGIEEALRATAQLPGPEPIVRAVHRALTAEHPKACYVVGAKTRLGGAADLLGPYRLTDHLKRVALGIGEPARNRLVEYAARRWCTPW